MLRRKRSGQSLQVTPQPARPSPPLTVNAIGIAKASHSNFYYAFFLLPKSRRDGIVALYAFMRLIDDRSRRGR